MYSQSKYLQCKSLLLILLMQVLFPNIFNKWHDFGNLFRVEFSHKPGWANFLFQFWMDQELFKHWNELYFEYLFVFFDKIYQNILWIRSCSFKTWLFFFNIQQRVTYKINLRSYKCIQMLIMYLEGKLLSSFYILKFMKGMETNFAFTPYNFCSSWEKEIVQK